MPTICKFNNDDIKCDKPATYKYLGKKEKLYCKIHKQSNMISADAERRICIKCKEVGKTTRKSFNFLTEKSPLYCKQHSKKGMVNFNSKNRKCQTCKDKQPSYGFDKKATHCSKCKLEGMNDLVSNLCDLEDCKKNATYGIIGQKATRCKPHSTENMLDVKNKKCVICIKLKIKKPKQPTYGIIKPTHCLEHKNENMTDLKHQKSLCKLCKIRATYGYNSKKPEYCVIHKLENMIDLTSKMCVKCKKVQGVFGINKKELYCKYCIPDGKKMKNIKAKMCIKCNDRQPTYDYPTEKIPRYCAGCQLEGMIDIRNPKCKSCGVFVVPLKPHLCIYCKPKSSLREKTKEMKVVSYLEENEIKFVHNKSVGFVCGNYRPDVKIDCLTHLVIVEIDENQHSQYEQSCEISRMLNIHQAEGLKCIFLRYNPDIFRCKGKAVKVHNNTRLKTLLKEIKKNMIKIPEDEISVYRLYYNNNNDGEHIKKYDIGFESMKMINALSQPKLDKHFLPPTRTIIQNSIQTFPDGIVIIEFMAEYPSTQEASRATGISEDRIKTICDDGELCVDDTFDWEYKE